ncbi:DUF2971 domain-containing protein [Pelosinus sp. sgz500959]|uniref:DUF2971 domain-containing protein n=1 Tax=Pelosinus sp. sgz500959 TaxID=3242472 RepID=UPI003670D7DF
MRLYKYCPWDINKNEHIRNNLIHSILYFQAPSLMNDPFDTSPSFQVNYNKKISLHHFIDLFEKDRLLPKAAKRKATKEFKNTKRAEEYARQLTNRIKKHVGICCFTTKPDNLLMWAHYADYHRGICLQFDFPSDQTIIPVPSKLSKHLSAILPQKVDYRRNRPIFTLFNKNFKEVKDYCLIKSDDWVYEDEYRAITPEYVGPANYNPIYLSGIILGCRTTQSDFNEIRYVVKKMPFQPRLYKTVVKKNEFALEIKQLSVNYHHL